MIFFISSESIAVCYYNGVNSNFEHIHCGVPEGSIVGQLTFIIHIKEFNCGIRYCSVRHFADDTNFLINNNSEKRMNKEVAQKI